MLYAMTVLLWTLSSTATEEQTLVDLEQRISPERLEARDVDVGQVLGQGILRLKSGHLVEWPGITLRPADEYWDLGKREYVTLAVRNIGDNTVRVSCRVDNPDADGSRHCVTGSVELEPGAEAELRVPLRRGLPEHLEERLYGMRGYPGGFVKDQGIDPSRINQILVFVPRPEEEHHFEITSIRVGGNLSAPEWLGMPEEDFFPIIDEYGQFIHKDWPGKIHGPEDFATRIAEESEDLASHTTPEGWSTYGGWASGPQLEATGYFRVQKHKSKWWLVDPDGFLFWSHGADCVHSRNAYTPITDREHWFGGLPAKDSGSGNFYGRGNWAPHGYYSGKQYETINFTGLNLQRKYGNNWPDTFNDLAHRRLRSWGMNTIANWSDESIYLQRRTPYVVSVNVNSRSLEGSEGFWGKFRDVFDPGFMAALRQRMSNEVDKSAKDPWCLGYFVDNELSWGDDISLAIGTLMSPPDQPAKKVFVADLQRKYGDIKELNVAWGSTYESWGDLLNSRSEPNTDLARPDLTEFYTKTAEAYFRQCREAVKEVAPDQLYLGCRFAWVNERAVVAAYKYCDVISYNQYKRSIADFHLPADLDKPVVIGEFHFGALDRGMFHTGLQATANQQERAEAYRHYVEGALRNPAIVGTHWFQYGDQATTGRGDGENYQIGFLDVADTPYWEIIDACRRIGYQLYEYRLKEGSR